MNTDRIGYSETFQVSEVSWKKVWLEASLSPGDDAETEIFILKSKVDSIKSKMGVSMTVPISEALPVEQIKKDPKEQAIDYQIEAIEGCTSLKSLEIFRKLVEREQNQRLTEAFENKLKSLQ